MGESIHTTTKVGGRALDGLLIDGTLKYCQIFFMHLNTKHGTVNGHYMSLVYCLL